MKTRVVVGRIRRQVAGPASRHELLDLAQILAAGRRTPGLLGRTRRHPRELLDRRERQLVRRKRVHQLGKICERTSDAHPLLRCARRVVQRALQVVDHRDEAELLPYLQPLGLVEPTHLLGIERRSLRPTGENTIAFEFFEQEIMIAARAERETARRETAHAAREATVWSEIKI
jgi:hypothetical protein